MSEVKRQSDYDSAAAAMQNRAGMVARVNATTATANVGLTAGHWKVSLKGGDPTIMVYLSLGIDNTITVAIPVQTATTVAATDSAATRIVSLRGDEIERIECFGTRTWVAYILSAGAVASDLHFTRLSKDG